MTQREVRSITVFRKGIPETFVTRLSDEEAFKVLSIKCDQEGAQASSFCRSLLEQGFMKLSAKQLDWVHFIAVEYLNKLNKPKPEPVPCTKLYTMMQFARLMNHMARPVIRLVSLEEGSPHTWSIKTSYARPQALVVILDRVKRLSGVIERDPATKQANFTSSGKDDEGELVAVLKAFEQDPVKVAKMYGQRTSNCCFCGRTLTTNDSIAAGYGPICAEKYCLPHEGMGDGDAGTGGFFANLAEAMENLEKERKEGAAC